MGDIGPRQARFDVLPVAGRFEPTSEDAGVEDATVDAAAATHGLTTPTGDRGRAGARTEPARA